MATLDSRFFCTSDLDTYYVDNASGLPMSGGIVTFYSDMNRTVLKPVYQLTGTPGNYSFSPLPNPIVLSSAGTVQDGAGNNIVPYYYPFMGLPSDNNGAGSGDQELYYITCVNSGMVPQFIRQGWPQAAAGGPSPFNEGEVDNFIPNGQFLSHNNIVSLTEPPIINLTIATQNIDAQEIAQGGWYFAYNHGTNAEFTNSYKEIPLTGGWGINSFPRWAFNFQCSSPGSGSAVRDLWITWPDVNKFSSGNPPGSIPYTLFFDAVSNDSNTYQFTIYLIYYYGTGGSSASVFSDPITTISVGPGLLSPHNITPINFLPPSPFTIGTDGNDFVGIAIRGPANAAFNAQFTDFVLAQGEDTFTSFPVQTNDQMLSRGVAGFMPTPDPTGLDMYLPLILTPQGMTFDQSIVGQIVAKPQIAALPNELLMNGTAYFANQFSPVGIPYQRIANYLAANSVAGAISGTVQWGAGVIPLFGTGADFVTLYNVTAALTTQFIIQINNPSSGGSATGTGAITIAATSPNIFYTATVNSVPTAGYFWSFVDGLVNLTYNVWYSVDTGGMAPITPTGANIQVSLVTGDTIATTIAKTLAAVNQYRFFIPDLRGQFLRGLGGVDPDAASRTVNDITFNGTAFTGAHLSSYQSYAILQHTHDATSSQFTLSSGATGGGATPTFGSSPTTGNITTGTGINISTEIRPVNFAVNWFIKY